MSEFPIVIPTHGRAGKVETFNVFRQSDVALCVAESQEPLYREHYPYANYIVHPDSVKGLPPKRDWIWKRFGDVFMVDDDVAYIQNRGAAAGDPTKLGPDEAYAVVQNLMEMAKGLGLSTCSFVSAGNPIGFNPMKPLKLQGSLQGHCMGMLNADRSKVFFNYAIQGMDDEWLTGLMYHFERFILLDDRYGFALKEVHAQEGGMADHRTTDGVKRDHELIRSSFGDVVADPGASRVRGMLGFRFKVPYITS